MKVKFSSESLAEQLVVWLTSEGKRSFKLIFIHEEGVLRPYPLFQHCSVSHFANLHIHTCQVKPQPCELALSQSGVVVKSDILLVTFHHSVVTQ